jgi:hypothetical protein
MLSNDYKPCSREHEEIKAQAWATLAQSQELLVESQSGVSQSWCVFQAKEAVGTALMDRTPCRTRSS